MPVQDVRIKINLFRNKKGRSLLPDNPGTSKLVCWLNLLFWVRENRPTGNLVDLDSDDIEFYSGWTGEKGNFFEFLLKNRWIDKLQKSYRIHAWKEHNIFAYHSKERSKQASNAAKVRWKNRAKRNTDSNADSITGSNAPIPTPTPVPKPTPDPALRNKKDGDVKI